MSREAEKLRIGNKSAWGRSAMPIIDGSIDYISGLSFDDFLEYADEITPGFRDMLRIQALGEDALNDYVAAMNQVSWEFEDTDAGGRGAAYNIAQRSLRNRHSGMTALLKLFSSNFAEIPDENSMILDVLGGDGTIARFAGALQGPRPCIVTADLSKYMINSCVAQGLPCIRQSATKSLFKDDVLAGVLIAYGSHHLSSAEREQAVTEGFRTIRVGGRLVLHDFEAGGKTAKWFEEVVHPYSRTGHPHPHFTRDEMWGLLNSAGFRDVRIMDLNDPFTLQGATGAEARHNAAMHLYHMYDLIKISNDREDLSRRVISCIEQTLGEIEIIQEEGLFTATVPRQALVAIGSK